MKRSPVAGASGMHRLALAVILGVAAGSCLAQDAQRRYWQDAWRGWHFYEEPEPPAIETPRLPEPAKSASGTAMLTTRQAPPKPPEIVEFERLQKAIEERRHIAIMNPTEANVRRYMQLESQVVSRASTFADVAQRIAWADPELDPSLQGRPVNAKALEMFDQLQMAQRSHAISALGRDHVLFFFFRGDCPYCHAFAPTLEAFQARHGIRIVAVSIDGGTLPGFADARRDNGIAAALRVEQVPAVFLAQPYTGRISPIGFGVLSEAQLIERIATIAAAPPVSPALSGNPQETVRSLARVSPTR